MSKKRMIENENNPNRTIKKTNRGRNGINYMKQNRQYNNRINEQKI